VTRIIFAQRDVKHKDETLLIIIHIGFETVIIGAIVPNERLVIDILKKPHAEGSTIMVVTHDPEVAEDGRGA
jgi:hypothetical protein